MKEERLIRLRQFLRDKNLDAVVINKLVNLHYFSGFTGDDTLLLISQDAAFLVTDFRYTEQAAKQAPLFEIVQQKEGLLKKAAMCIKEAGWRCIGFEGNALLYDDYAALTKLLTSVSFNTALSLDVLREVKDKEEIDYVKKAVEISDKAFEDIVKFIRPGVSENAVAARLERVMRELGSERPAFTTIVASGIRGSLPHGTATEKLIVSGEFVTMDYGAVYKGYHSDITRTICVGHADGRQRELYDIVCKAQLMGVRAVKPGVSGRSVDRLVRDYLTSAGYGDCFGHGLGHSLGLEIHEEPRLSPSSTCEHLKTDTLITVEPGVYLPGWGGLRIEDTVLVTETGGLPLTCSSKKLIEIL
jgi:Xaa-Pro aminopeptidase